jgi:7tm Odorant receptor
MAQTFGFCMTFLVLAHFTISSWAVAPFSMEKMQLPIVAWFKRLILFPKYLPKQLLIFYFRYPFSTENPWIFSLVYIYQIFGISMSACFNVATDTFASAIISQTNGQVRRLGIQLSKVTKTF